MMIKYKVNEVAKDLGVNSKKVIEVLDKYCGVQKKTTTTLEENELNVVFDYFTQDKNLDNLDAYYAKRNAGIEEVEKNYSDFEEKISLMDANLRSIGSEAKDNNKNTIVASSNTLKFLNDYGFNVISLGDNENLKEAI